MEIDITDFFNNADAFEYSASRAERGNNAGAETWKNAKRKAKSAPLLKTPDQIDALRRYVKDFGAWSEGDITAWNKIECNALFIQLIAGDMREGGLDSDPDESDWSDYQKGAEAGRYAGNIYRADGKIYYSLQC